LWARQGKIGVSCILRGLAKKFLHSKAEKFDINNTPLICAKAFYFRIK
jgi:hypothetical protein